MTVRRTDSVHLVPTGVVAVVSAAVVSAAVVSAAVVSAAVVSAAVVSAAVVSAAVTAGKAQERHGSHARGTENHAENIEVHLILDVARVASPAQSRGELRPQIGVQPGAIDRTAFVPPKRFRCQLAITPLFPPRYPRSSAFPVHCGRPVLWR
jgi:hypothetical protein